MNLEHTGDPLYKHVAAEFADRPGMMTGDDGSRGEWVECEDGFDLYIDDWHVMRENDNGDLFKNVPQTDRWRLVDFNGEDVESW